MLKHQTIVAVVLKVTTANCSINLLLTTFQHCRVQQRRVDHVGGLAQKTIQRAIVTGGSFENATCMIDFFKQKY